MAETDTRTALLDAAQKLTQTRGYNGFSFRDLAHLIGIKTASIHYWFPTKGDLGRELMSRYRKEFAVALADIESRTPDAKRRLKAFVELFRTTLRTGNRMCLCGMLAVEYATLPQAVQKEIEEFFDDCERWLTRILEEGREAKAFAFEGDAQNSARVLFASLEGAMMVARAFEDESRLAAVGQWMMNVVSR
jgi:TetR/AcrR family transcriptional regulator, transcriptional repressor for nem operon